MLFLLVLSAGCNTGPCCNTTTAPGGCVNGAPILPSCAASYSWSARTDWSVGTIHENVVFDTIVPSQQAMTIWSTGAQSGADPVPVMVYVHGGSWGGKDHTPANMHSVFLPFIAKGFLLVSLGYRLSGTAIYPANIDDIETGIRWLKANAATYNLDPNKMIVGGVSAGGHLVDLLGTRNGPNSPNRVAAIVNFYGPTQVNFPVPADSGIARMLGCTTGGTPGTACYDTATEASPIVHVDAADPPFLHLYGDADTTSPPIFATNFQDAFVAAGHSDSTLIMSPGAGHFSSDVLNSYPNGHQIFQDWVVAHAKCAPTGGTPPVASPPPPAAVTPTPPPPAAVTSTVGMTLRASGTVADYTDVVKIQIAQAFGRSLTGVWARDITVDVLAGSVLIVLKVATPGSGGATSASVVSALSSLTPVTATAILGWQGVSLSITVEAIESPAALVADDWDGTTSPPSPPPSADVDGLSTGAIIGIAAGGGATALLVAALVGVGVLRHKGGGKTDAAETELDRVGSQA